MPPEIQTTVEELELMKQRVIAQIEGQNRSDEPLSDHDKHLIGMAVSAAAHMLAERKVANVVSDVILHPVNPMTPAQRADQMWRVHPRDLDRLCMTRHQFYETHIHASIAQARRKDRAMTDPKQTTNPSEYEYRAVQVPDSIGRLQPSLDEHSKGGWRLVQTFVSSGYTVGLIFERQKS